MFGSIGLDLSLTNTGMCHVPARWDGSMSELSIASFGAKKMQGVIGKASESRDLIFRYLKIAKVVVDFIASKKSDDGVPLVAIEGYAFSFARKGSGPGSSSVTKLAELGGVVKSQVLLSTKKAPVSFSSSEARKIVIGKMTKGNAKEQVRDTLFSFGMRFVNDDEMDAFVISYANYCSENRIQSRFIDIGF